MVYNNGSNTVIVCSQPASSDNVYTSTLGTVTDNKITVPSGFAEGTYTITYTTWNTGSDEAKVTYTQTFEVRNTHSVTLDKNRLDRNAGTSTDKITITANINGNPVSSELSNLSVVTIAENGTEEETSGFTITPDTSTYTLECINTVTPGTYYVKFVQKIYNSASNASDKKDAVAEYAQFTVVE